MTLYKKSFHRPLKLAYKNQARVTDLREHWGYVI